MITLTKRASGGFTIVEGSNEPSYESNLWYWTKTTGIVLTNPSGGYETQETAFADWTIDGNTGFANLEAVANALDDLGVAYFSQVKDYNTEVALGKINDTTLWNKWGYNDDIDVGTEVIASWGGMFDPLTTATTISIVSTSANDIVTTGTGTNTLVLYGIDANRDEVIEVINLNGTTPVVTTSTWLGLNRMVMFLCGTSQVNEGTITATAVTGGSTMAQMPVGEGVTQQCIFHVPRNNSFVAEWLWVNILNRGKNAEVTVKMWVYSAVSNGKQEVFKIDIDTQTTDGAIPINPKLPFPLTEQTVLWLEATSDTANVNLNARFSGILNIN